MKMPLSIATVVIALMNPAIAFAAPGTAQPGAEADSLCPPSLPEDVCRMEELVYAHTDFTRTEDVREAMVGLKETYVAHASDAAVIRRHILRLVDHVIAEANEARAPKSLLGEATGRPNLFTVDRKLRAHEREHGPVVPLDWALPEGVRLLVFISEKAYDPMQDRTEYRAGLFAGLDAPGLLEDVKVVRYPDEVLLDKAHGGWHETLLGEEKVPFVSLGAGDLAGPVKEGLYLLVLKVKGQPAVNGWFLYSHATPAAVPVVKTPSLNEAFATGKPTLRWIDFKSPQYRPFEHRKRALSIRSEESSPLPGLKLLEINPPPGSTLALGSEPGFPGKLAPGRYTFGISFEERWLAGAGLFVGRKSGTDVPFSITK